MGVDTSRKGCYERTLARKMTVVTCLYYVCRIDAVVNGIIVDLNKRATKNEGLLTLTLQESPHTQPM